MYNLAEDPCEQSDLVSPHPEEVARLSRMLNTFLAAVDAELPVVADSTEGQRTLALHAEGKKKGWHPRCKASRKIMNKKTEYDFAMKERAVQEGKRSVGDGE